jgi:hypothetical protein
VSKGAGAVSSGPTHTVPMRNPTGGVSGLWVHTHTSVLHQQAGNLGKVAVDGVLVR